MANFPELNKPQLPKRYECLGKIKGFFIDNNSVIWEFKKADSNIYNDKNIHKTEKEAKSSLAKAQLSQLMSVYRGDWVPNWNDSRQNKYCIYLDECECRITSYCSYYCYLSFPTIQIAKEFLTNFEQLIKEYYEL